LRPESYQLVGCKTSPSASPPHIYTFNEIEKIKAWQQEMLDRIEAQRQ